MRACALVLASVLLAACATGGGGGGGSARETPHRTAPETYVVRAGDTLFAISSRFGLDYRDVARWNRLGDGTLIYPGQALRLRPPSGSAPAPSSGPAATVATPMPSWQWPAAGRVALRFRESTKTASGIVVAGERGEDVVSAAAGEVVYAGNGLTGYGELVIVRHDAYWLSAYGYNDRLLVREGDRVGAGQPIARMGSGAGLDAALHFEIRRDGEPLDPLRCLPPR